jgi:hypothetical protein
MTPEQIIQIIRKHQHEYTTEAEEQYRQAMTCDKIADREYYNAQANFAVARAAALSRLVLEMTDLDAAVKHLLDAEQVMIRMRDREVY